MTKKRRIITCEFESFYLVNVYTPNSQQALSRLSYRMSWEVEFKKFLKALELKKTGHCVWGFECGSQ